MEETSKKQIEDLIKRFEQIETSLSQAQKILRNLENDYLKVDYAKIEGVTGKFDGNCMLGDDGKKYEVPANYAAKSKLVYGDILKLIEEEGKKLFKQIQRVPREKVEGILTKKEGEWYLLTDRGSYKVSDAAAVYQNAQLNCEAIAYLPEDNLDAPFATLDRVEGAEPKEATVEAKKKPAVKEPRKEEDLKDLGGKEIDLKKDSKAKQETPKKETMSKPAAPKKETASRVEDKPRATRPARPSRPAPKRPSRPVPEKKEEKKVEKAEETAKSAKPIEDDDLI